MTPTFRILIGALTDFIVTSGSSLTGYMVANGAIVMPTTPMWILACVLGGVGAAKQVNAMLGDYKSLLLPIVASVGLLSGCATLQKEVVKIETDFSKATLADVDMAIAMAQVAKDSGAPYRLRCYSTLRKYVPESIAAAQPVAIKGVVSAYEKVAELDALARQGVGAVPADIHADCAVIGINAQEFLARVGLKFGGSLVPGGSLLPNLLGPILK